MSSQRVERSTRLSAPPSRDEMFYNLDSHADIQRAHPAYKGSSYQSQPGSLDQLTPADAVYDGSFYWPKDGSAHPSVSASHSATGSANLPCNTLAALAVVTSMIEVMLGVGMEVSQLKPAALMLSSCHLDIAKQLRAEAGRDTTESKYHFNKGCEGLRDIYGAFDQPPSTSSEPIPFCSSFSSVLRHGDNGRSSQQRSPQEATPDSHSCSPEATLPCSQLKILEGEVQSLRNRQEDQAEALNRARTAKRKLEEDLEGERHVRRKLERRLDQAESEASGAQKGEKFALAQCRAEVETRRRAEERADDMRQEAEEVRTSLEPRIAQYGEWERNLKDFFGKLGIVCLKAARGEFGEVLSGRL
ncbi:uncharacterized protein TRAVEDRAFT_69158 [Trametes versicolor FP-101664 SS1]|uniref:uncharacterized protein n=1 Tax=Trametes versicolor (strain FP-101664) TaxID=717944 RepID=UPI00046243A7|nr:uncharacterized protein TRAVEDRAFT_69158 [Trametes versicolor FP-101664 SS1]EIW62988.1 hypothetical protein TRAVEDRAFT_69158 [Trametes versicolor FP-101664 SS1]